MNSTTHRMTPQRRQIFDVLRGTKSHPTASQVYDAVRAALPRISIATVYRNLDVLTRCGLARKLDMVGGEAHYDADMSAHHHIRCSGCGRVDDVRVTGLEAPLRTVSTETGYAVTGHRQEFEGLCPTCQDEEAASNGHGTPRGNVSNGGVPAHTDKE